MENIRKNNRNKKEANLKTRFGSASNPNRIDNEKEKEYLKRLRCPYVKNGETKIFYNQYENAPGKELDGSFWSPRSSSRFAFEAYSWLAKEEFCKDIEVEYKLPKIHDGRGKENNRIMPPTMDVFIRTESDIWFIESKFLEFVDVKDNFNSLSESYFKENRSGLLLNRYHENKKISDGIPKMIESIASYLSRTKDSFEDYFEPKQEITHLIGIALWLHSNPSILSDIKLGKMKLNFFNVVYDFGEEDNGCAAEFRRFFIKTAQETFWDMFEIELNYKIKYSQEFIDELLSLAENKRETKSFASDVTVLQQLEQFN